MNLNRNYALNAESIASALQKPKRAGLGKYVACCPAHDDKTPSLSIQDASDRVLVHCHAGCSQDEVVGALRGMGLWHTASRHQRARHKHYELKKTILHHQRMILLGAASTVELSEADIAQMKESMEFLKEHAHG